MSPDAGTPPEPGGATDPAPSKPGGATDPAPPDARSTPAPPGDDAPGGTAPNAPSTIPPGTLSDRSAIAAPEAPPPPTFVPLPAQRPPARAVPAWLRLAASARVVALTAIVTLTMLFFLLAEPTPRWLLIVAAIAAALGVDGTLRATWRAAFSEASPVETAEYLFLPVLYVLATPILIEHNARGYAVIPAGLAAGLGFGMILVAQLLSTPQPGQEHPAARLVGSAGTYFTAFAFFALFYVFDASLRPSVGAVALVSVMLAIEMLRDGQIDPLETIVYACISGLLLGELRWVLHYVPLDGYLAGLALVLGFFFVTGVIGSYMTRRLDAILAVEYVIVVALGLALVIAARATGAA
jgi:hypothetical protein